jgi:hypothetical protein
LPLRTIETGRVSRAGRRRGEPMRYVSMVMALVFAGFALVQYNDPDALLWIALYGVAFAASLAGALGRFSPWAGLGLAVYLPLALWWWPSDATYWLESEEKRESLGLLICAVWMAVLLAAWALGRRPSPTP